jgi:hypothetical protein
MQRFFNTDYILMEHGMAAYFVPATYHFAQALWMTPAHPTYEEKCPFDTRLIAKIQVVDQGGLAPVRKVFPTIQTHTGRHRTPPWLHIEAVDQQ